MTVDESMFLNLPEDAAARIRSSLALSDHCPLRIAYLPGPGDTKTTFEFWRAGKFDPRVPSVAYSTMFFDLCAAANASNVLLLGRALEGKPAHSEAGRQFEVIKFAPPSYGIGYHSANFHYATRCINRVRRFRPHITVVASDFDWKYLPFLKTRGTRLIYSMHNTFWPMGSRTLTTMQKANTVLMGRCLRTIDAAVCTSHECERQLREVVGQSLRTFVAQPQTFPATKISAPRTGPATRLFYLGRIEKSKGVFDLLDSFHALHRKNKNLKLVYAGDGAALPELRAAISALGIEQYVVTHGYLTSDETHAELAKSDVLICPTRTDFNEGLAFVCFEAALHGVPTVMSSVVPAQDLLENAAVVFPANSMEELTSAIASLTDNQENYEEHSRTTLERSKLLFDRSNSWGNQLFKLISTPTPPT